MSDRGFFVIFLFQQCQQSLQQELYMDVYVELESVNGVDIAMIRNNETLSFGVADPTSSKIGLSISSPMGINYIATSQIYYANIEAVSNNEIFCAKNIGLKITSFENNLRVPAISLLSTYIMRWNIPMSFFQIPPSFILQKFAPFFTKLQGKLKVGTKKTPAQWMSLFDDTLWSYFTTSNHMDFILTQNIQENISLYNTTSEEEKATEVLVILSTLVDTWSSLLCRDISISNSVDGNSSDAMKNNSVSTNNLLLSSIEFISRQIRFFHLLYNFITQI
jgi:hypothetical protein